MKKLVIMFALALLLSGCATTKEKASDPKWIGESALDVLSNDACNIID